MQTKDTTVQGQDREPNVYEVGYLLVPTIAEPQVADEVNVVKNAIESLQSLFIADGGTPELMTLAYPMDHVVANKHTLYESAYFGWVKFHARPEAVKELETALKGNKHLIRFMIIRTIKENTVLPKKFGTAPRKRDDAPAAAAPALTEAEIDKTVDELISTTAPAA